MSSVEDTLEGFGAERADLRLFDRDGPDLLPYATLVAGRSQLDSDLAAIAGVYEWQSSPLMFIVDAGRLGNDHDRLRRIRRLAAFRGDAPYLGVVSPGRLEIYSVGLDSRKTEQVRVHIPTTGDQKLTTFALLANIRPGAPTHGRWISDVVLRLLTDAIDSLKSDCGVSDKDAISLVGRALFVRFLADRKLLVGSFWEPLEHHETFDTAQNAERTSTWLDTTFNGDFLPLTDSVFESLPPAGFRILGNILRRAPGGELYLGWKLKWDNLDFAHIPVGVLSQAYEHYLRKHAPDRQRREGGYYTPRAIAEVMVHGAFAGLDSKTPPDQVRVLDPAAGAGVFLLIAFRRIVAERWRHTGTRPDTLTLRDILYNQISGFDINEAALRFAALGLYLASIELDAHPEPVEKLGFKNLRSTVLYKFGDDSANAKEGLGSLGPQVGDEHKSQYHIVIGNPPWASATHLADWSLVKTRVEQIARKRLSAEKVPALLPNEVLDLAFVWRAMEWGCPGAQITFALHGRVLFQQGDGMPEARKTLFSALDVKGIVNAAHLRSTKVWPHISAPFCILYARNDLPPLGGGFRFLTPYVEDSLNKFGVMRIDATSAELVSLGELDERPAVLKILSRGGRMDMDIYDRILSRNLCSLGKYWSQLFGESRGRSGNGYQTIKPSSRIRKGKVQPGASASELWGLPEITSDAMDDIQIRTRTLDKFSRRRIHDPRPRNLFNGPLLIVQKSPPAALGRMRVAVCDRDAIFNETYYGYNAKGHPDASLLVRYLALLIGSKTVFWLILMTSGEFGFEREVVEKKIVDSVPIPTLSDLPARERERIDTLFSSIVAGDHDAWRNVDRWAARLYGLKDRDLDAISDTLTFNLPFSESRRLAQTAPREVDVKEFCKILTAELEPWGTRFHNPIHVVPFANSRSMPWRTLQISANGSSSKNNAIENNFPWERFVDFADDIAATELAYVDQSNCRMLIGRLNQARYWTKTQARSVAERIIWRHVDFLSGRYRT
jgi:hypothetical protein